MDPLLCVWLTHEDYRPYRQKIPWYDCFEQHIPELTFVMHFIINQGIKYSNGSQALASEEINYRFNNNKTHQRSCSNVFCKFYYPLITDSVGLFISSCPCYVLTWLQCLDLKTATIDSVFKLSGLFHNFKLTWYNLLKIRSQVGLQSIWVEQICMLLEFNLTEEESNNLFNTVTGTL